MPSVPVVSTTYILWLIIKWSWRLCNLDIYNVLPLMQVWCQLTLATTSLHFTLKNHQKVSAAYSPWRTATSLSPCHPPICWHTIYGGKPYWVSMVVVCEPEPITFSLIYGGIGFVPGQFQTHHHQRLVRKWKLAFHVYGQPFLCKKERNKSNAVIHVCTRITVPYTINYYMYYTRQTYCSGHTHFLKGF